MSKIKTYNKISEDGLKKFREKSYEISTDHDAPDAIVVRSQNLHDISLNPELKAIGRAGAGVNNIPVSECSKKGIVVFNTPGANANAVKELVIAALLLEARNIIPAVEFAKSLKGKGEAVHQLVEDSKAKFQGCELNGKRIGIIGLGAIGVMVANDLANFGMDVSGYDPFISVNHAWGLSSTVKQAGSLNGLLAKSDYITIHVPLTDGTKGIINDQCLSQFKRGSILLNFSRPEVVEEDAVLEALKSGHLAQYVTDFPTEKLLQSDKTICIPHLGASTKEAENNCAIMIADQLINYLENGNIKNAVNFPNCELDRIGKYRLAIIHNNIPNMVGQITAELAKESLNIVEMVNKSKGDLAYTLLDLNDHPSSGVITQIKSIQGIIQARVI